MNGAKEMAKVFAKGVDYELVRKAMKAQGFGWLSTKGKEKYLPSTEELYFFIKKMVKLILENDDLNCIDNGNIIFTKVFKTDAVEVAINFPVIFKLEFEIEYDDFEEDDDNFEDDGDCPDCSGEGCDCGCDFDDDDEDYEDYNDEDTFDGEKLIKNLSDTIGDLQAQIAYYEDRFSELIRRYEKSHDADGKEMEPTDIQKEIIMNVKFILDDRKEE